MPLDPANLSIAPGTLNPANLVPSDQYDRAQADKSIEDQSEDAATKSAVASAEALPDWIKKSSVTKGVVGALNAPMANDAQLEQFRLDHPILGAAEPLIKFGEGVDRALLQGGTRAVGALPGVNDDIVQRTLQAEQRQIPVSGPLATAGEVTGNIASMVATPGTALPSVIAAQAVGQGKADAAVLRGQGQEVSPTQEFFGTAGPAALQSGIVSALGSAPFKGITQRVSDAVAPYLPEWINTLGPEGASRAVASFIGKSVPAAGAAAASQIADNLISQHTLDPNRPLMQNVGANAAQLGITHGLTGEPVNPRVAGVVEPEAASTGQAGEVVEGHVVSPLTGTIEPEQAQPETVEGQESPRPPAQKVLPGPNPANLVPVALTEPSQTPNAQPEPARPAAEPKTATQEPSNVLEALRQRMETSRSEGTFGPDHPGTQEEVDAAHRARIAEESKPKSEPTPEENAARQQAQLQQLHPDAQIEPHTGEYVADLEQRLNEVERRTNAQEPNPGQRAEDTGPLPEHEFKAPEEVQEPSENLKSQLTPNETIRGHAAGYAKQAGIDHNPDRNYEPVDTERAGNIAKAYDALTHNPNDPAVKASYDALKKETLDQYNYLKDQGVKIEPWTGEGQPYANSKEMAADAAKGHLYVYMGGNMPADHPLAEEAPGTGMTYNSVFRAVHDYFGHAQEGNGFGPKGEEHAWKQHVALYSDAAKPAMTAETRGQNSWVNYGPNGEANRANPANTTYAQQKAGLLPDQYNGTAAESANTTLAKAKLKQAFPGAEPHEPENAEQKSMRDTLRKAGVEPIFYKGLSEDQSGITLYDGSGRQNHVFINTEGTPEEIRDTVAHEFTHALQENDPDRYDRIVAGITPKELEAARIEYVKSIGEDPTDPSFDAEHMHDEAVAHVIGTRARTNPSLIQTVGTEGQNVPPNAGQNQATNTPNEPQPESDFFAKMREVGARAQAAAATLISDEGGGFDVNAATNAAKAFVKQDVVPTVQRSIEKTKNLAVAIDKALNLGFSTTPEGREAELGLRGMQGKADVAAHEFESQLAPYLKHVPSLADNRAAAVQYANELEAGGSGGITALKPAAALLQAKRSSNEARAKDLGITNLDQLGFGISRMFVPVDPDEAARLAGDPSLMGKYPFYSQKHNTYGAALQAAEAKGLKPADDNILVSQLRRQYQVERYLGALEKRRADEDTGAIQWRRQGDPADPQYDTKMTDPKFGQEERHGALPSWMVARYNQIAKKDGAFEAQNYINSNKGQMEWVRPGEKPSKGNSFTGVKETGQFYAPEDVARYYNNLMPKVNNDPIGKVASGVAHAAVLARYTFGPFHALQAYLTGVGTQLGGLRRGEATWGDVVTGGLTQGARIDRISQNLATATPQQRDLVQRLAAVNAAGELSSVTDEQALAGYQDAMRNNNPIGAQVRLVRAAFRKADGLVRAVLQNVTRGAAVNEAQRQQKAGITDNEALAKVYDDVAQKLGLHTRGNEFKSAPLHNVVRAFFPAFDFMAGQHANLASAAKGAYDRANGQSTPSGNPRALANLAYLGLTVAALNSIMQMISTTINTGKPIPPESFRDLMQFRTGNKDANGNWERFGTPNMFLNLYKEVMNPLGELWGHLNPGITNTVETVQNKDWQGNQVRPDDASHIGNFFRGAGHIASGAVPISANALLSSNPEGEPESPFHRGASVFGQFSHPVTSEAEQIGYDALHERGNVGGRNLRAQEIKTTTARWAEQLRADPSSEDAVRDEMDKTRWMTPTIAKAVYRRAQAPLGAAALVEDHEIGPDTILKMWNAATDDEKAQMQDGINARLNDIPKNTSPDEYEKWGQLNEQVGVTRGN